MQLQTYYKHLQTKPTNCKKVATNYKNVATNANKHLQTKPTNTQKVTTNANKCQQTPKTKPTNTIINLLQTYYKFVVGLQCHLVQKFHFRPITYYKLSIVIVNGYYKRHYKLCSRVTTNKLQTETNLLQTYYKRQQSLQQVCSRFVVPVQEGNS